MKKRDITRLLSLMLSLNVSIGCLASCVSADIPSDTTAQTAAETTAVTTAAETTVETEAVEELLEPMIWDLSTDGYKNDDLTLFRMSNTTETGTYVQDLAEGAIRLTYSEDKRGAYRCMPHFKNKNKWDDRYEYFVVKYKTDYSWSIPMVINNNGTNHIVTIEENTGVANGVWTYTQPFKIGGTEYGDRFEIGSWFTLALDSPMTDLSIWIKEIALFCTPEQAYEYYGYEPAAEANSLTWDLTSTTQTTYWLRTAEDSVIWVDSANGKTHYDHGMWDVSTTDNAIRLHYSPADANGTEYKRGNYRMMPKFVTASSLSEEFKYARILYKATNAEDEPGKVSIYLRNNGAWGNDYILFEDDVQNTNGNFVLSDTAAVSKTTIDRLNLPYHMTLYFDAKKDGGEYYVRSIHFFKTKEEADAFDPNAGYGNITIGGVDISEFKIVISANTTDDVKKAAASLASMISRQTGVSVPIVTDDTIESEHEIIIGNTRRAASEYYYGNQGIYTLNRDNNITSEIAVRDGKLHIAGGMQLATVEAVTQALTLFGSTSGNNLEIKSDFKLEDVLNAKTVNWDDPEKGVVETFSDDFNDETANSSPNYWIEHALTDYWQVKADGGNLVYAVDASRESYSWLHVFERDVEYTAKMKVTEAANDAVVGMLLRFNEDEAYVRVGYDFKYGEWYITDKQGHDYEIYVHDRFAADMVLGEWVTVRAVLNGKTMSVYINGSAEPVMTAENIHHLSSGRVGFYTNGADAMFDDVNLVQTSGQGKVQDGVVEMAFGPRTGDVAKGGTSASVFELADGSLIMQGTGLISHDDGITWEKLTGWGEGKGSGVIANVFRLQSGRLINMVKETVNGKLCHISQYSDDDGKTWHNGGVISEVDYKGYGTVTGINMNDKFTQMSDGRIFVSQNYEGKLPDGDPNAYANVFVEIYYSDDEGMTWTRSENDSFDTNVEKYERFGESKVVEGTNGQLIWLTNWSDAPDMLYSVSTDNGVTWSETKHIEELVVTCSSSGIMRDPYAEEQTYYMVMVFNSQTLAQQNQLVMPRSRLGLFRSHDGINWEYLMDVDRWEDTTLYPGYMIHHYVNPAITVTEDYIYVGSGRSDSAKLNTGYHNDQSTMFLRIEKDKLEAYDIWPTVY